MTNGPHLQTQFVIFVLFGDIVLPRGGWVWTTSLLQMLEVLGVTERAARSTLSRMRRKGWLKPERQGRHSLYTLTARGRRILDEGSHRIFDPRQRGWDGLWYQLVYSLPENKRRLRNDLRKRLTWLGFGRLAPGTWISPHHRRAEVDAMLDDLGAQRYVHLFSGLRLENGSDREIVERCWDTRGLNRQYGQFVARWAPKYERCAADLIRGNGPSPADCFGQRFWITHEYSPFPRLDPGLPDALLPEDWLGENATELFNGYRGLLTARATEFVDDVYRSPNGHKA
jgi:phenylacetic acid degradation operon negative regulatory protein